jgi:hypothetical protein
MVPQRHLGKAPHGHRKAGARGYCKPCYIKQLRAGWPDEPKQEQPARRRVIDPERLEEIRHLNTVAGHYHYIQHRRARIARHARLALIQKAAS